MSRRLMFAIGSVALAAVLTLIGTFYGPDDAPFWTWLVILGIILVATAIVFWAIVPRIRNLSRGALILAILGALLILVFWTGLPAIFAGGAAFLALAAREAGQDGKATVALVLAALTVIAVSVIAFLG